MCVELKRITQALFDAIIKNRENNHEITILMNTFRPFAHFLAQISTSSLST